MEGFSAAIAKTTQEVSPSDIERKALGICISQAKTPQVLSAPNLLYCDDASL